MLPWNMSIFFENNLQKLAFNYAFTYKYNVHKSNVSLFLLLTETVKCNGGISYKKIINANNNCYLE